MNELLRQLLFLPPQRSTLAAEIDALHYFVILVTMAGSVLVAAFAAYFVIRYRRRHGSALGPYPDARTRPPMWLEAAVIVGLFLLFILWWWIGAVQFVALRVAPKDAMKVHVTGKQWMWQFAYPGGERAISTLHVPARRPVELILTSRDVIHSFFVPAFRIKQDAVPGRYTTVWFEVTEPGTYPIYCTEYCGTDHAQMRGEVVALEPLEYERWLAGAGLAAVAAPLAPQDDAPANVFDLVAIGRTVAAEQGCLKCHSLDGSPHIGPTFAALYGAVVPLEGEAEAHGDEAYITESMMDPTARVHRGYPPVMPSYLGRIRPADTAAIVELIRALRDVAPQGPDAPAFKAPPGAPVTLPDLAVPQGLRRPEVQNVETPK